MAKNNQKKRKKEKGRAQRGLDPFPYFYQLQNYCQSG
jgi:hypothetical protein